MDKVFEKVTLYDILGYVFPGCLFLIIVGIDFFIVNKPIMIKAIEMVKDNNAIVIMILFIVSHIVGTLLSQLSESGVVSKVLFPHQAKKKLLVDEDLVRDVEERFERADIIIALKEEGGYSYAKLNKKALDYIYSVIQVDADFSRIHGYASSEILSRNSALACLIGSITTAISIAITYYNNTINNNYYLIQIAIFATALFLGFLFLRVRSENFAKRKIMYAVSWFVSKYKGKRALRRSTSATQ